jgi:phosphatidylinositol alpha-1,6-mannosyltransferase
MGVGSMIVGLFPDLIPVGGVQLAGRHTAAVLARLSAERGWESRFLSLNDSAGEHELNVAGVAVRFTGFGRSKRRFTARAVALARDARIVVAAHPHLAVPASAMRARSKKFCLLVQAHGIEVWEPMSALRRICLRRADIVTAPSRYTAGKLHEIQRLPEAKIRILPWGMDPTFLELAERVSEFAQPLGIPNARYVLAVGRWSSAERYKGFDTLIRVLPGLLRDAPDLHLVLAGDGDDRPSLEELAKTMRVEQRIHFVSGLSRQQLVACYAGADVFALPSSGEGFGFVFLEAMALGRAVVGGNHGGVPDIIEEGITGFLVTHGDEKHLGSILSLLLTDRALREEMGRRGRDRVMQKFAFPNFEAGLREILTKSCGV